MQDLAKTYRSKSIDRSILVFWHAGKILEKPDELVHLGSLAVGIFRCVLGRFSSLHLRIQCAKNIAVVYCYF